MKLATTPDRPHRWLWFAALYAGSVGTLAVVAFGLRAVLGALGQIGRAP